MTWKILVYRPRGFTWWMVLLELLLGIIIAMNAQRSRQD